MKLTKENIEKGQTLFQELAKRAWESASFKEQLISDPESAIAEITGKDSMHLRDKKIVVEDQSNTNFIYLNIPKKVDLNNFELTDEQLEVVAGGEDCTDGVNNPITLLGYYVTKGLHDFDMWLGELVFG